MRKLFFSLAKACTVVEFEELMRRMDEINPKHRAYLQKANYVKWSRAHSPVKRTWTLTSNIVELLNNAIFIGRWLPVIPLFEFVRKTIEVWNEKHNEEDRKRTITLTSKYNEMLVDNRKLSHHMFVSITNSLLKCMFWFYTDNVFSYMKLHATEYLHTITDGATRLAVCLITWTCSYDRFQHDKIPYTHAIAAIRYRNKHREDYCSGYYSNKNYQDTYVIPIKSLPCESTGMFRHMTWKR